MCTLLIRHKPGDPYPLAILSNRDERYGRPSAGWEWRDAQPPYFAPLDELAGGTWIGLSERGVVVGLTNIFPSLEGDDFTSRGALVAGMLSLTAAKKARRRVRQLIDEQSFNKFNLLVADGFEAVVLSWDGLGLWDGSLAPGTYQIGNDAWNGAKLPEAAGSNSAWLTANRDRLKEHPSICKHGDGYGTRSSSLLLLDALNPTQSQIWHAEGHPCENEYIKVPIPARAS